MGRPLSWWLTMREKLSQLIIVVGVAALVLSLAAVQWIPSKKVVPLDDDDSAVLGDDDDSAEG